MKLEVGKSYSNYQEILPKGKPWLDNGILEKAFEDSANGEITLYQFLFKDGKEVKRVVKKFKNIEDYKQKVAIHNRTCSTDKCICK